MEGLGRLVKPGQVREFAVIASRLRRSALPLGVVLTPAPETGLGECISDTLVPDRIGRGMRHRIASGLHDGQLLLQVGPRWEGAMGDRELLRVIDRGRCEKGTADHSRYPRRSVADRRRSRLDLREVHPDDQSLFRSVHDQ
jgi:hypothetical protein